ncbi:MAG: membrane integrity-associated transporter subunit PqiC [Verrucomicrobia bacterium]|nr:membrane integrity-associated transporter subunit PqiC [Verrucomicrobiota bacterium]
MNSPARSPRRLLSAFLAAGLLAWVAGCNLIPPPQADPTHYYVLNGPSLTEAGSPGGKLRLGLRPLELAPYLRKGAIVVRLGSNELLYKDEARWGEPLEAGISRTLRAQLLTQPAVARVYTPPYPIDQDRDYDIAVTILRCEGATDNAGHSTAKFSAQIEITSVKNPGLVVARRIFNAPDAAWDGHNYSALAESLSAAIAALSAETVAALPDTP